MVTQGVGSKTRLGPGLIYGVLTGLRNVKDSFVSTGARSSGNCVAMHRFFVDPQQGTGDEIELEGREAHHALHVVRVKAGEEVWVLDGMGHERRCTVISSSRQSMRLKVEETKLTPAPEVRITLLQAIPKGKAWENILQKATELGAYRIIPVITERVVVQADGDKVEKWKWIAIDALKQCGNPWLPQIETPRKLAELLGKAAELTLIAALEGKAEHPRVVLDAHRGKLRSVSVWIGPEGDFTPAELRAIIDSGARPITLGPRVLRADTAAIYCLSVIQYELA
jgi:16S rRNA (uracil1498-N3)-methyltransferase